MIPILASVILAKVLKFQFNNLDNVLLLKWQKRNNLHIQFNHEKQYRNIDMSL